MMSDWLPLLVSVALGAAVLYIVRWRRYSTHFARRGVPHIAPLPVFDNMVDLTLNRKSIADLVKELYDRLDPHPYAGTFAFNKPLVLIRDTELIRAITIKDFDHFTDHINFGANDTTNKILSRMIVFLKGKEWRDMRLTLSPAYSSMKMKNVSVYISEIAQQMLQYLSKNIAEEAGKYNGLTIEMRDFFKRVANDVIATAAFGVKVDSLTEPNNTFYSMCHGFINVSPLVNLGHFISSKLMNFLGIPFFDPKTVKFFRSLVKETIRIREEQGIVRQDMIHLLMQARNDQLASEDEEKNGLNEKKTIPRLTDEDIAAQALMFFLAGFDTMSTAMTFCSYLLATHEDVQRRLLGEVDDLMKKSAGNPTYEQVMGCQYLDMVISETLRMYAPAPFLDRVCTRPYRFPATESCAGFELQPGEEIWVPVHGVHNDPKYFPHPERFDPERFSPENKHLIKPFTYFPFGCGPRFCIAQRFALMEAKIVLVHLLSQFSLHVVPKTAVPLILDPANVMSLSIKGGTWLGVRRRTETTLSTLKT